MILFMNKGDGCLRPTRASQIEFDKLRQGECRVEIKRPRNVQFHKLFYALVQLLLNNQDYYKKPEQLVNFFKRNTGLYDVFMDHKGVEHIEYKSISFSSMDDIEFNDFYSACVVLSIEIVGCTESELRNEVLKFA